LTGYKFFMQEFQIFKKRIVLQILITAAIVAVGALVIGQESAAKGFVLGSLFSVANFLMMARHAVNGLGESQGRATARRLFSLGLRMGILALPIYLAFRIPELDLLFTVLGVFNLQVSIILHGLVIERLIPANDSAAQGR
jgi:hypothetical protein